MGNKTRVVVLDGYTVNPGDNPWSELEQVADCTIHDRTAPEQTEARSIDAEVLLLSKVKLDETILNSLPKLKYISMLATGYNNVDVAAAGARGIAVSNIPAYSTESVAQATFALLLELAQQVGVHDASVKAGDWQSCPDFSYCKSELLELHGLTLGIVGFGSIGRSVARIGAAFGMNVIAYTPRLPVDAASLSVRFCSLAEVCAIADVVTLHCPQTPENGGFVNAALLQSMKSSALLLNVARGGLVNEADLADALRNGTIAGAGVDVVAQEPILADNPLLTAPNCIITPHNAWASLAARKRLMKIVVGNVAAYCAGSPQHVVNLRFLKS